MIYGGELTVDELGNLLRSAAPGDASGRELHVTPVQNSHGTVGSVFLSLNGSPPKAYGLYIPVLRELSVYDLRGERQRVFQEARITELVGGHHG